MTRDIQRFLLATIEDDKSQTDEVKIDDSNSKEDEWKGVIQLHEEGQQEKHGEDDSNSKDDEWKDVIELHEEGQQEKQGDESNYLSLAQSLTGGIRKEIILGWRQNIIRLSCAHTHAFRHQMRPKCEMDGRNSALRDRNRFLTQSEQTELLPCRNQGNSILFMAAKILGKAHRENRIDTYSMIHAQGLLDSLCTIQTACERIHNTSLPLAYSLLVHRTAFIYVVLIPFAIVESMGWWTPLFTAIVAYTFFGLHQLAKEIQEPFSDRPMCLALSAMCRTIEIDTLEALGKESLQFLKPKGNVLM